MVPAIPPPVKTEDGKYYDKEGNPTYKVQSDGTVDWSTYSGFRRYHSDCHVCHGPGRRRVELRPGAEQFVEDASLSDFSNVVVNGRKNVSTAQENVMPSFGTNRNVMCYLEDVFVYFRARANDAILADGRKSTKTSPSAGHQVRKQLSRPSGLSARGRAGHQLRTHGLAGRIKQ